MEEGAVMTEATKTKLCWNCNAEVERSAENCLYCGVYLHPSPEDLDTSTGDTPFASPPPLYQPEETKEEELLVEEETEVEAPIEQAPPEQSELKATALPLTFLIMGSIFFLFSLILLLFSTDGLLVMKWDATYWFVYLFLSLPLLFVGWKSLQSLDEK